MDVLRSIRNYFFYSGIERDEYNAVKKDAYISNYEVWRILHFLMVAAFAFLYVSTFFNDLLKSNSVFYLTGLAYSVAVVCIFLVIRKDSLLGQLIIYLSISLLFIFACLITQNKPELPATTFIVFLLVTPMFMIDKPFFMTIELCAASAVFLVWMYYVKPYDVWEMDMINVVIFTIAGIFLNIIANSIRIKEFVLTREINIQKDTDELTGLRNKGALTREINKILEDENCDKGIMFLLDVDRFKSINDTYGHDIGDDVIARLGKTLGKMFTKDEIVGRFGGDEFIIFIRDTDNRDEAKKIAEDIMKNASENITLPEKDNTVSVSIGAAIYNGSENTIPGSSKKLTQPFTDQREMRKTDSASMNKTTAGPVRYTFPAGN